MSAVFGQAEKSPPDQFQVAQGYAVFELLAIKPASTPTFEEIRSRVEEEFKNERVAALLDQKTQELSDRAKAEHDLKKAAKEAGRPSRPATLCCRTDRFRTSDPWRAAPRWHSAMKTG